MTKNSISSIRKMLVALTAIVFTFAFTACNNKGGKEEDKNVKTFKEAVMNLDNTTHTLEYEYDYWPEGGIRATGSHLASLISLGELEKMLPCPLYLSGPHTDGEWDLYNWEEFGHYNPEAVEYLVNIAGDMVADEKFVESSRPLVEKYLSKQMYLMMVLHDVLYDEDMYDDDYREYFFTELLDNYGYSEEAYYLISSLDLEDGSDIYSYFSY